MTSLQVLRLAPENGFAKVHLGFIVKTSDNLPEESIGLLRDGIASEEPGVIDGRFYFHLGDALQRLGRVEEAYDVYEDGARRGDTNISRSRYFTSFNSCVLLSRKVCSSPSSSARSTTSTV